VHPVLTYSSCLPDNALQSLTSQTSGGAGVAPDGEGSAPAPLTEEQRDAALELREKLRIVQTVLEQVGVGEGGL
jgi:hypothetical protein